MTTEQLCVCFRQRRKENEITFNNLFLLLIIYSEPLLTFSISIMLIKISTEELLHQPSEAIFSYALSLVFCWPLLSYELFDLPMLFSDLFYLLVIYLYSWTVCIASLCQLVKSLVYVYFVMSVCVFVSRHLLFFMSPDYFVYMYDILDLNFCSFYFLSLSYFVHVNLINIILNYLNSIKSNLIKLI